MKIKKLVSILLATVMAALCALPCMAFAAQEKCEMTCPQIYVHGFMAKTIYENADDENSDTVWPPSSNQIFSAVKELLPAIVKAASSGNSSALTEPLVSALKDLFEPSFLDKNAQSAENTDVMFSYPTKEEILQKTVDGEEIKFCYDWRLSPLESAQKLNDFIEYVRSAAQSDKVTLSCHSFGGIVVLSYTALYGYGKLSGVVFDSTAIYKCVFLLLTVSSYFVSFARRPL